MNTYTAKVISIRPDKDYPMIPVVTIQFYKDGVEFGEVDIERGFTAEQLTNYCKNKIRDWQTEDAQLQGMANLIANPPTDIDLSDPEPTPEELLRQKIAHVASLKEQVDLGIISADDPVFLQAINEAKAISVSNLEAKPLMP